MKKTMLSLAVLVSTSMTHTMSHLEISKKLRNDMDNDTITLETLNTAYQIDKIEGNIINEKFTLRAQVPILFSHAMMCYGNQLETNLQDQLILDTITSLCSSHFFEKIPNLDKKFTAKALFEASQNCIAIKENPTLHNIITTYYNTHQ